MMIWFIFFGDMLVMAFMIGLAIWFTNRGNAEVIDRIARIPLEDDNEPPTTVPTPASSGVAPTSPNDSSEATHG
ncbi:MAG: hypothetical protein ACR2PR_01335 [Pseudohongiellaceae bacterium]